MIDETTTTETSPAEETSPALPEETAPAALPCPVCGETAFKPVAPRDTLVTFQQDRQCAACGAIWRPACPRWGANLFVILGIIFLFLAADLCFVLTSNDSWTRETIIVGVLVSLFGVTCLAYGIQVLRGKTGQQRVLTPGQAEGKE
ncbi:MAG TPA: hypothetical protein VGM23_03155 [Armatimonadota bacterium]|jgi:hypothetical protein